MYNEQIDCPYCGEYNDADTDDLHDGSEREQECEHCNKIFCFGAELELKLTGSYKKDCSDYEDKRDHKWEDKKFNDGKEYQECSECEKIRNK